MPRSAVVLFFFFNDTATTEIYTLSLHDALPIYIRVVLCPMDFRDADVPAGSSRPAWVRQLYCRSEEHTSELQSPCNLVCRLLLEKKKWNAVARYLSKSRRSRVVLNLGQVSRRVN